MLLILALSIGFSDPAQAQLSYQAGQGGAQDAPASANEKAIENLTVTVKETRGNETSVRPDWYGLFLLWTKANPTEVLSGLRDPKTFDNFTHFMACDWVRDYRANDVAWPARQTQIVQKFNEHVLNPQTSFRLLTYAVLGPYVAGQQQFVFRPLDNAGFAIKFPDDKVFGVENDCAASHAAPQVPWPSEFVIDFSNPHFITTLPMPQDQAEIFLNNLPKDAKGEPDRRLVVEVELTGADFGPESALENKVPTPNNYAMPPVPVKFTAMRAIVYADKNRTQELMRYGFAPPSAAPPISPAPPK